MRRHQPPRWWWSRRRCPRRCGWWGIRGGFRSERDRFGLCVHVGVAGMTCSFGQLIVHPQPPSPPCRQLALPRRHAHHAAPLRPAGAGRVRGPAPRGPAGPPHRVAHGAIRYITGCGRRPVAATYMYGLTYLRSLHITPGELEALHRDRWKDIWAGAGIELELQNSPPQQPPAASVPLPAAVNASLLALLGAGREDWPYGVAAGGLSEGGHGHVRWGTFEPICILPRPQNTQTFKYHTATQPQQTRRSTSFRPSSS